MNKLLLAAALASATFATHADNAPARRTIQLRQIDVPARKIQLSSPDFKNGGRFAAAQTAGALCCEGANISSALNWSGVPKEAKSLVLTMYDPDAPAGSGVWHWLVYNLPPDSTGLPAGAGTNNALPAGAKVLKGDVGRLDYIGACPPKGDGTHRYIITLYALNQMLDLPDETNGATLGFHLNGKILASGQLVATYSRAAE